MVDRVPRTPIGKDNRAPIRSLEEMMAAPAADTPDTLLSERGAVVRELGRRLMTPLAEAIREMEGRDG